MGNLIQTSLKILLVLIIPAGCFLCASHNKLTSFKDDPDYKLLNVKQKLFIIPIQNIHIDYFNNTKPMPDVLFPDTFFIDAANSLTRYYCLKSFLLCDNCEKLVEYKRAADLFNTQRFSTLFEGTADSITVAGKVRRVAAFFKVDLILVPFSCTIKHIAYQPKGWTDAPSYKRPVKYKARTDVHFQIWDKTGKLLYERFGRSDTGRPIAYRYLKNDMPEKNYARYSQRLYAPPIIKSLEKAIEIALNVEK